MQIRNLDFECYKEAIKKHQTYQEDGTHDLEKR